MTRIEMEFVDKVAQYRNYIKEIQKLTTDQKDEIAILRKSIAKLEIEIDEFIKDFFE